MSMLPHDMNYWASFDANKEAGPKESLTAQPSNGSSFNMNQPIEITVPMRQPEFVCDFKNCYVSLDFVNSDANNIVSFQSYVGTLGIVNQQVIKTSTGTEFSNFDGYNVLSPILIEKQVDTNWYGGNGNILFGMADDSNAKGDDIAANSGDTIHKILPLINTGIAQPYFPMGSLADIVLRFKLDTTAVAFSAPSATTTPDNSSITIKNIVLHYDIYKLSPSALSSIHSRLPNNNYVIDTTDWVHQQYSSPATDTKYSVSIGFAKKKAKRLIMVSRDTAELDVLLNKGLMSRNQAGITKVSVKLDGKIYQNSAGIQMSTTANNTNYVDAYAELLKNDGGLLDMKTNSLTLARFSKLTGGTAPTTLATCGAWYHEIDFSNSMDTDSSASGVSIDHNNLQVFVEKAQTDAQTVDFFIEFYNQYTMNRNEGVWYVSDPVQYSQA